MNGRTVSTGKTRICPHCKATILDSASICPACRHHLRFDSAALVQQRARSSFSALRVEGRFGNTGAGAQRRVFAQPALPHVAAREPAAEKQTWEYSVVVAIHDDRGEELVRQVIGVGALPPDESRTVTLSVEVFTPAPITK